MRLRKIALFLIPYAAACSANAPEKIDIAIIGNGCSGLGAALVTCEFNYSTVVFTGKQSGGSLNVKTIVGNWPGLEATYGDNIMNTFSSQIEARKGRIEHQNIVCCDFSKKPFLLETSCGKKYLAKTVLIATGTKERNPNTPGYEKYQKHGVWSNDFMFENFPLFCESVKNQNVAVVGGGEDAMKKAIYACRSGAKKVYVLSRSSKLKLSDMRIQRLEQNPKIEILYGATVEEYFGDSKNLEGLHILHDGAKKTLNVTFAIISIGREPNSEIFQSQIKTDKKGYILTQCKSQMTNIQGVFASGDVANGANYGQAAIAAGDGMKAGYEMIHFLTLDEPIEQKLFSSCTNQ